MSNNQRIRRHISIQIFISNYQLTWPQPWRLICSRYQPSLNQKQLLIAYWPWLLAFHELHYKLSIEITNHPIFNVCHFSSRDTESLIFPSQEGLCRVERGLVLLATLCAKSIFCAFHLLTSRLVSIKGWSDRDWADLWQWVSVGWVLAQSNV